MGEIIRLSDHARASAGAGAGYKSGRSSCRGTPVTRSTASTRSGGTSSHCETACSEMPSGPAKPAKPPTAAIARWSGSVLSAMAEISSIALPESQAALHCVSKAALYSAGMTLGRRIKAARERLEPKLTQQDLADRLGTTDKAVSGWERDKAVPEFAKMPELRRILRVTYAWLVEGHTAAPPDADDPEVLIEDRAINLYRKERSRVA